MDAKEAALLLMVSVYCGGPLLVIVMIAWVATRGSRGRARGMAALNEGRLVQALEDFEACDDKLVLKGQVHLWLWQLASAIALLNHAMGFNPEKYEDQAAPFLALAAALRNDHDAEAWVLRAGGSLSGGLAEARLAEAVLALRRNEWGKAADLLRPLRLSNVRAAALRDALLAWAETSLDGQSRAVNSADVLGEGSITELEQGFPALAKVLRAGRAGA